ncbi:MAG: ABC transporter ATP-binding protein [Spirochaetales bacterium]|nr:ABC transporter ATP-binding protein [Spirochaetales bacterium]
MRCKVGKINRIVDIENAVVSYREDVALRGVSLKVTAGDFTGIIGPNGAGKTTLLTLINGLGKVISGKVRVFGIPVVPGKGHFLRKRIGYVAQVENIDPRMPMSVRDVVLIGRYGHLGFLRRPGRYDREMVDTTLESVGMYHLRDRPIGHLSGGEQQRVAIARCLVQEPEIFLLDEPTASLDWRAKADILDLVRMIHEKHQLTTLFVTHDLGCLPFVCGKIILMKEGLIYGEGSPSELFTAETLSRLYDIPLHIAEKRLNEPAFI